MDIYSLSRGWFDWSFENPEKVSPNHTAIFFFAIEHCNRLGWKEKFGFPTQMAMDAIGIKKPHTYIKYFNELVEWGFIKLIQKSTNQYSANIISLNIAMPKNGQALGKATAKHAAKQTQKQPSGNGQSTRQSNGPIDIHNTTLPNYIFTIIPIIHNLKISVEENEKLVNEFGKEFTDKCYRFLSDYKIEKSYKTKSDYLTIKRWVIDAVKKQIQQNGTSKQNGQLKGIIQPPTIDPIENWGR